MDYIVTVSPFWKDLYLDCSNCDGLYTPQALAFPTWHCHKQHQDNELEVQWCLSWLTELCESPQSKRHARHAWVHLLQETSVSLNITSFILLTDDSALVVKTYTVLWIHAHWLLSHVPSQGLDVKTVMLSGHPSHCFIRCRHSLLYIIQKLRHMLPMCNQTFWLSATSPNIPSLLLLNFKFYGQGMKQCHCLPKSQEWSNT